MQSKRLCTNTYLAIIDKLTFEKVQRRLRKNKILAGANSAVKPYLLTGKAFCRHCGTAMIAGGGTSRLGKKHYYYVCKKIKSSARKSERTKTCWNTLLHSIVYEFLSEPQNVAIAAKTR